MTEPVRICFVCLGNICRSPTAEAIFVSLVDQAGLGDRIEVHSAGTAGYHVGEPPDERATAEVERRGLRMVSRGRKVARSDIDDFDLLVAMDRSNFRILQDLVVRDDHRGEVRMMLEFASENPGQRDVPDPYYGEDDGFVRVYDMVEDACRNLLQHVVDEHDLR